MHTDDKNFLKNIEEKALTWTSNEYDLHTQNEVKNLLAQTDKSALIDAFYKNLAFGTGGLRGIMGAGSNRMNIYTVGAATQGLANYLNKQFKHLPSISVVIGYDCRNNSQLFSDTVANIFSANGIKAYVFDALRPTPEISFAIRHLKAQGGVIITASHNPKEYNGYKAYWDDGAQLVPPHDKHVIEEVNAIDSVKDIRFEGKTELIEVLGSDMDELYLEALTQLKLSPASIRKYHDLNIVYTPIHGTGVKLVPGILRKFGFTNIFNVPEQDVISGEFPTVISPNPEEAAALDLAIQKGKEVDADLVIATDPDSDRFGIAIKDDAGTYILVNGNQTALLISYYMLRRWKELGKITGHEFYVKTIVSSELMKVIAENHGVECFDCYTGFKWIAAIIRELEGKKKYICGGEESYGFLPCDFIRDKDAVASSAVMAELTAWAKDQDLSLYDLLLNIYIEYGFSYEKMVYIVKEGKTGAEEIEAMMSDFRNKPPQFLAGEKIVKIKDFQSLTQYNIREDNTSPLDMPEKSNVLQFFTDKGSKISLRPSGTEPKIKFYFEVKGELLDRKDYHAACKIAENTISKIIEEMGVSN